MLVVDVETTGLDPKRHSIVSIGALLLKKYYGSRLEFIKDFMANAGYWDGARIFKACLDQILYCNLTE